MEIVLASQSPRRQELIKLITNNVRVQVADIDETMDASKPVYDEVARVSLMKALAVGAEDEIVVAADTVVVCDGQVLGKPKDEADAFRMLSMLSGRTHQVMTGLSVVKNEKQRSVTEVTDVTFRKLSDEEIWAYIETKDPMDKAGSYGIQSGGALFVQGICGDYFNVVGLPVCRLGQLLRELEEKV